MSLFNLSKSNFTYLVNEALAFSKSLCWNNRCSDEAPRFIKTQTPIHFLYLPPACSTTSQHFHLPPHYENDQLMINISLNTAKLNVWWMSHLQNLEYGNILRTTGTGQLTSLGQQTISSYWSTLQAHDQQQQTHHSICFNQWVNRWYSIPMDTMFHTGIYVFAIGLLIPTGLGIFCCYFFLVLTCHISTLAFTSGSLWHTIVDDGVEAAPIYRCDSMAEQPVIRPHKNHDLCMKWEPTWMESQQKQQAQSKGVPTSGPLDRKSKIQGMWWAHTVCCHRIRPVTSSLTDWQIYIWKTIAT